MALKLKDKAGINAYIKSMSVKIERGIIYYFGALLAKAENHAKLNAEYEDQTSNLKSSIGGILLKNGKVLVSKGFDKEGIADKGDIIGLEFVNSLIADIGTGYGIIIVAGMEYASYVENYHNLNVLKKTELYMNQQIPIAILDIKEAIRA